jgi:DNA-binding response OmpR family regulator
VAVIGIVGSDAEDRRRLSLLAGEAGHQAHSAGRLDETVEILRELRPRAMVVVDSADSDAGVLLREVLRAAPLMPVVVALKVRDSARAVALMRTGAAEVVPPPWTPESVKASLSKSLRHQGTALSLSKRRRNWSAHAYLAAVAVFVGASLGYLSWRRVQAQRAAAAAVDARAHWELPYRHPAAMAFDHGTLFVADWFSQAVYAHDARTLSVKSVAHFPNEMPVALAMGSEAAWSASAGGVIVRHMKDAMMTPLERSAAPRTLALAFDGLYLWSIEGGKTPVIRKRLPDGRASPVASYRYPGSRPAALVWDGAALWSLDAGNRELVRHNPERPDEPTGRMPLIEYSDGVYRPVALGFDGKDFWTIGERRDAKGPARLFRHGTAKL